MYGICLKIFQEKRLANIDNSFARKPLRRGLNPSGDVYRGSLYYFLCIFINFNNHKLKKHRILVAPH